MAHRSPRRVDRRLVVAGRVEPGAMRSGDLAVEIGDRGDHRRPGLGRRPGVRAIVAAGMKAQASGSGQSSNAAIAQIRFYDCAENRLRHGEQPLRRFRRSGRCGRGPALMVGSGSDLGRLRKRRASMATSWKSARPRLSRITSRRSPCSPVAASLLCAVEHKTDYVAPRFMLRNFDWALSHRRLTASTQHNASVLREVA